MASWTTVRPEHDAATRGGVLLKTTLTEADPTADWIRLPARADVCVQLDGTFGAGGVVSIEGSNQDDAVTATAFVVRPVNDATTRLSALGAADGWQLLEHPYMLRARATAGTGFTISVYLLAVSAREF